jgi:hypothetical protein
MLTVKVRAELRCYFCGYLSARIEGEQGRPLAEARLVNASTGEEAAMPARELPRCSRCAGPLFMDPPEIVRQYSFADEPEPSPRRGRPPRPFVVPSPGARSSH